MFETIVSSVEGAIHAGHPHRHGGGERVAPGHALNHSATRMLDEVDYGMLLVGDEAQLVHINRVAQRELDADHPLQLLGNSLRAQRAQDIAPLFAALSCAQRGLRRLLRLGDAARRVYVSVVPLETEGTPLALIVLGRRQVCEHLSLQGFARNLGLTVAEARVLDRLCAGISPAVIAQQQGVAVCTVRTQIGSIRSKVGASSIGDLIRIAAALPPLLGVLPNRPPLHFQ